RLNVFKDGGAEVFYDKLCAEYTEYRPAVVKNLLEGIDLDSGVSKQQAAFLMNHMLIYLGRDNVFQTDETGEVDPRLYVPTYVQRDEIESLCKAILASGQENAEMTVKKLNAFYVMKTYDGLPTENYKTGQPLTEEEIEQQKLELQQIFPIVDAFESYVYDPYASRRENNHIAGFFKSVAGFNYTDTQSLHGMANYPTMMPYIIGEDSYEKNLIGTITDKVLKAEIEAAYIHDEAREVYTLDTTLDAELLKNLGSRLARNSSYSYAQMHSDHAINGYSYLHGEISGAITMEDIYPKAEELPESFREEESFIMDGAEYALKVMTISSYKKLLDAVNEEDAVKRLNAFYACKDPYDEKLQPRAAAEIKYRWGDFGEEGVYIMDPYAKASELEMIDAIYEKAFSADNRSTVYSMPVREYTGYKDELYIHDYAIHSVKELVRFGIIDDGGRLNPNGSLKYSDAAEMVTKFTASLIAY
nr:hypothetical protein [Clostridia bacterium]